MSVFRWLLAVVVGVGLCGCGASTKPQGGGSVTQLSGPGTMKFPSLGHRSVAPRLPAGVSAQTMLVVDFRNVGAVAPAQMRLASDTTATRLRWTSWGTARTTATGSATVRICTSSCGAGYFRTYPVTLTLSGLARCRSHRFYDRATLVLHTATGTKPWGALINDPC